MQLMGRDLPSFKLLPIFIQGTSLTFSGLFFIPCRLPLLLELHSYGCGSFFFGLRMTVAMEMGWQVPELCPSSLSQKSTTKKNAWSEDPQKILSLMMGKPAEGDSATGIRPFHSEIVQLDHEQEMPLPSGWEKRLDLKSGSISFVNCSTGLSTINDPRILQTSWPNQNSSLCLDLLQSNATASTKIDSAALYNSPTSTLEEGHLDLELNLGYKATTRKAFPSSSSSSSHLNPAYKMQKGKSSDHKRNSSSEDHSERIIVKGCKSCLMYVMLSQTNPQCPRCGSYIVLDNHPIPLPKKLKA